MIFSCEPDIDRDIAVIGKSDLRTFVECMDVEVPASSVPS